VSDKAINKTMAERILRDPEDRQFFEKMFPGWIFNDCIIEEDDNNGFRFYIRMRKYEPKWGSPLMAISFREQVPEERVLKGRVYEDPLGPVILSHCPSIVQLLKHPVQSPRAQEGRR
jgi:hypothetical protein